MSRRRSLQPADLMISPRPALLFILVMAWIIFEERVSMPSCKVVEDRSSDHGEDWKSSSSIVLNVMMVANLLLMGSEAGYMDTYFRHPHMSKFFRKSFEKLKPDMLIVLGDLSARGSELTNIKWLAVLHQFQGILGPFLGLPVHIVLGDRDIGECGKLNPIFINRIADNLPGLNPSGCGAFQVSNISFLSLNSVALLCDNSSLRYSVEKAIERASLAIRTSCKETLEISDVSTNWSYQKFQQIEKSVKHVLGPVLLLHLPLYREHSSCNDVTGLGGDTERSTHRRSSLFSNRRYFDSAPYELFQTVPLNATEYIFHALRPRYLLKP